MLIGARRALVRTPIVATWSPLNISGCVLWLDASDLSTLFQSNAGATAVTADNDVVGYWGDKSGNSFHVTSAADDGTRPTYNTDGTLHWINFDGTDDILRRTAALSPVGTGAACTVAAAVKGNPGTTRYLFALGRSSTTNPIYSLLSNVSGASASQSRTVLRDDGGVNYQPATHTITNAYDNTDNVVTVTDSGSGLVSYLDGSQTDSDAYTYATTTLDRTAVGGLLRTSASGFFACDLYQLVVYNSVLGATDLANLTTFLGAKMGRVL